MNCPVYKDANLAKAECQEIAFGYCAKCRGVQDRDDAEFRVVERVTGLLK